MSFKFFKFNALLLLIFVGIQSFNLILSSSALRKETTVNTLSAYRSASSILDTNIERGLRYGKPLKGFTGLQSYIDNAGESIDETVVIAVLDKEEKILNTTIFKNDIEPDQYIKSALQQSKVNRVKQSTMPKWINLDNLYADIHPLIGFNNTVKGYLVFIVNKDRIEVLNNEFYRKSLIDLFLYASFLIVIQIVVWSIYSGVLSETKDNTASPSINFSIARIKIVALSLIAGIQIIYILSVAYSFSESVTVSVEKKIKDIATPLVYNLEYLAEKNLNLAHLTGLNQELAKIVNTTPEAQGIQVEFQGNIISTYGDKFYENTRSEAITLPIYKVWPDRYTPRQIIGNISIVKSSDYLYQAVRPLAINLATSLVVCFIFLIDIGKIFEYFIKTSGVTQKHNVSPIKIKKTNLSPMIRGMSFVFFFGFDMGISFIPIAARDFGGDLFGLSRDFLASLPVASDLLLAGVGIILAGFYSKKISWQFLFITGAILGGIGCIISGLSPNIGSFVIARALSGLGFGIVIMAGQIGLLREENQAEGLGDMFAGVLAGSLCGCAVGAMLADYFNFAWVFYISGGFCFLILLFVPFIDWKSSMPAPVNVDKEKEVKSSKTTFEDFILVAKTPMVWVTLLMIGLPVATCFSGFLYYLVPSVLKAKEISQGDIGRIFMIYSLCFIYLGPPLGRLIDRTKKYMFGATISCILSGFALIVAAVFPTFWGYALSVFITGVAQCLAGSSILLYVLSIPAIKKVSKDGAASLIRFIERGNQVLGPLVFAGIFISMNFNSNLLTLGIIYVVAAILFMVVHCLFQNLKFARAK